MLVLKRAREVPGGIVNEEGPGFDSLTLDAFGGPSRTRTCNQTVMSGRL